MFSVYTEQQEYTLMRVITTVGCRTLTSHWSPMCRTSNVFICWSDARVVMGALVFKWNP